MSILIDQETTLNFHGDKSQVVNFSDGTHQYAVS